MSLLGQMYSSPLLFVLLVGTCDEISKDQRSNIKMKWKGYLKVLKFGSPIKWWVKTEMWNLLANFTLIHRLH